MRIEALKNRIKKMEPDTKCDRFIGSIEENSPNAWPPGEGRCWGMFRVSGYVGGLLCTFGGGYAYNFQDAIEKLKRDLRKFTLENCNIYHTYIDDNREFTLKDAFILDGMEVKPHPGQLVKVLPDCAIINEFRNEDREAGQDIGWLDLLSEA